MSDETKCHGNDSLPWGEPTNPLLAHINQLEQQLAVAVAALKKIAKLTGFGKYAASIAAEALKQIGANDGR